MGKMTGQANASPRHARGGDVAGQAGARPQRIRAAGALGQASIELLSILAVAILTIIVFMAMAINFLSSTNMQKNQELARDSVQRLALAADSAYAQGEGASNVVSISIPASAIFNPNLTFIGKPQNASFSDPSTEINIRVWDTDVYATTAGPVHGSFPASSGAHLMRVYSAGRYVVITPHIASVDRQAVFVSMAQGETRTETLRVRSLAGVSVSATAAASWLFPDVTLSLPPSSFTPSDLGTPLEINITANENASGLYNTELVIAAQGIVAGENESFTIPLTVDVH